MLRKRFLINYFMADSPKALASTLFSKQGYLVSCDGSCRVIQHLLISHGVAGK